MAEVFVVMQCIAYEGDSLMGVFSTESAAGAFVESKEEEDSDSVWYEIRRVEIDKIYKEFDEVGEEI